jgi:two-component system nitrate/nitrite response regulator NarL
MYPLRLLLVIDVPFYREGLQRLLAQDEAIEVVGAVTTDEARCAAMRDAPSLVLLDISPPGARQCLERMRELSPPPRVVALAVDETRDSVVSWIEAGICGYVSKNSTSTELIHALHTAARGEWACSQLVMSQIMNRLSTLVVDARSTAAIPIALTTRERQILELVAKGMSNKRIAIALSISHATAKNHVHHILEKLQVHNRTEVAACLRAVSPPPRPLLPPMEESTALPD